MVCVVHLQLEEEEARRVQEEEARLRAEEEERLATLAKIKELVGMACCGTCHGGPQWLSFKPETHVCCAFEH